MNIISNIKEIKFKINQKVKVISLTDEKAMSQKNSPFKNIGTLIDYITMILDEK